MFIASISKEALFGIPIPWMYFKCGAVRVAVVLIAERMRQDTKNLEQTNGADGLYRKL